MTTMHDQVAASGSVDELTFSPDGTLLAAAREYAVELRDGTTGRPLRVLAGHTEAVQGLAFSPDGGRLASASRDGTVRIWDVPTGQVGRVLAVDGPRAVRFSPDGTRLAVAGYRGLFVLDPASGDIAGAEMVLAPDTGFDSVAFSPDGSLIAALEQHVGCQVFDAVTGTLRLRLPGPGESAWRRLRNRAWSRRLVEADFTGDGSELATVALDGAIRVWDAATGELRTSAPPLPRPDRPVSVAIVLPDPVRVVAAPSEVAHLLAVREAATGAVVDDLHLDGLPTSFAVALGGRRIAAGTSEGRLYLWAEPGAEAITFRDKAYNPLWDVTFSPDGRLLATVTNDGDALLWEVDTGRIRKRFRGKLYRRVTIAFTPDGVGVALAGPRHAPQIRDLDGRRVRMTLDHPAGKTAALAFSPDGRRLVTVDKDDRVRLWDVTDRELLLTVEASADRAVFAPDGETIALVDSYGVTMWHPASGDLSTVLSDGDGRSRLQDAIVFSPDGRLAAAPADLDKILIWDCGTGEVVRILSDVDSACAVAFSPSGDLLAVAPDEGAPLVYDAATGARRHELTGHLAGVTALAFAPDGTTLVTASIDGAARIWDTVTGALLSTFVR
jgi:WD40 repeat protein